MELKAMLHRNQNIRNEVGELLVQVGVMEARIRDLRKLLVPPCKECRYDGVYRCEACEENFYEGFNVADYPPTGVIDEDKF